MERSRSTFQGDIGHTTPPRVTERNCSGRAPRPRAGLDAGQPQRRGLLGALAVALLVQDDSSGGQGLASRSAAALHADAGPAGELLQTRGSKPPSLQLGLRSWHQSRFARAGAPASCVSRQASRSVGLCTKSFKYVADPRNYPNWMAHALDVQTETPGPPRQNDKFVLAIKSVGRRFEAPYERTVLRARPALYGSRPGRPNP